MLIQSQDVASNQQLIFQKQNTHPSVNDVFIATRCKELEHNDGIMTVMKRNKPQMDHQMDQEWYLSCRTYWDIATRSKDATRGSWPYYLEQERY